MSLNQIVKLLVNNQYKAAQSVLESMPKLCVELISKRKQLGVFINLELEWEVQTAQVYFNLTDDSILMSISLEMVGELIDAGLSPNTLDDAGQTPLIQAVRHDEEDSVRVLLEKGADPNFPGSHGFTPLEIGDPGNPKIKKMLIDAGAK